MTSDIRRSFVDLTGRDLLITRDFTAEDLQSRRQRIADDIGKGAHLLIPSAPASPSDTRVQDANFYYFTGLETSASFLIVEGGSGKATVFVPSRDTMTGEEQNRLGHEDAELIKERTGVHEVLTPADLTEALGEVGHVFLPYAEVEGGGVGPDGANGCAKRREDDEWDQAEPRHKRMIRLLKERFPSIGIDDACPLIYRMRTIKSEAELVVMRQAGHLSARVMVEAIKATRPGMTENQLQAIAEYVFRDEGHCPTGYGIIAGSGPRTWDGHYGLNNAAMGDEDIILMDCGPDLRHYTSDIARMWPVNGTYSEWHRRRYGFIVEYHKALIGAVRPGIRFSQVYEEAESKMADLCMRDSAPYADMKPVYENMLGKGIGYLNHGVGMSVHDAMEATWKEDPIREGLVCVVDPMVWCEDRHEYIRVEDTIVVTADGCERLTGEAPIEMDEIEALMQNA